MNISLRKKRFVQVLKERFFLRFHMSLILIGTALVGLLVSKLLLSAQVTNIVIRYPLAVVAAYLAFFGFIKLWLFYVVRSNSQACNGRDAILDGVSSIPDFSGAYVPSPSGGTFGGGGGGSFGGGGFSGSFEDAAAVIDSGPDGIASVADEAGETASGVVEEGGWVLVVLGLLLAIVFGAGIFLMYQAPFILTEAAFDFALSASLLKSARKMDGPEWTGSVFRATWKPFLFVLAIALIAASFIHSWFPEAHKVSEIFHP